VKRGSASELRPRIWPPLLRLVTKAMPDRLLAPTLLWQATRAVSKDEDVNSTGRGGKPSLHAVEWAPSLVGGASRTSMANKIERNWRDTGRELREGMPRYPPQIVRRVKGCVLPLLGEWRIGCRRASARGHVQQIVSHPMVRLLSLQGMVMDHDHLIVISLRHRKPLTILIDLVR